MQSDKRFDGVLQWFSQVDRMENDRIAKRLYAGERAGSRLVSRPRNRWIDTMKDCFCLKKRGLDVRPARIMVHDESVWWGL